MCPLVIPKIELVKEEDNYGSFVAEPLERGFGITLGNALRRTLLSSLPGAAVNWVRIGGMQHELCTLPYMKEDVTDFLLNIRAIRLRPLANREGKLFLDIEGEGCVYAADIKPSADFEIINPELYLATLDSAEAKLKVELNVILGKGYKPASYDGLPIGAIPVDAIFSPVRKVNFRVEPTKTDQYSGYERLILDILTDGTNSPREALSQSAQILTEQFSPFTSLTLPPQEEIQPPPSIPAEQYNLPIEELGLSTRTFHALKWNNITKLGELLEKSQRELLWLERVGEKSVEEVKQCLEKMGLSLKEEK